jgi:hypothetical protein
VRPADSELVAACAAGDLAAVERLVAAGANVNATERSRYDPQISADVGSQPCLMVAVQNGHLEIARLLLDAGADINRWDGVGESALTAAVYTGNRPTAEMLLDRGADLERMGMGGTPLFNAVAGGNEDLVRLLLDRGARVDATTYSGDTPLKTALRYGSQNLADLLRAHGATA